MHDIDDHLLSVFDALFLTTLGRRIAADIKTLAANGNLLAVGLVCYSVNLLEPVRVGDDLVVGDEVLWGQAKSTLVSNLVDPWTMEGGRDTL